MSKFALRTALPDYLREEQARMEEYGRAFGLDFFPTIFEVLSYDQMNEIAAYGGFPVRYPHWRFGMEYEQLSKSYEYGLSKIYEMVINNTPAIAYLLEGNSLVEQKLVMAHVLGHVDFFKNNFAFRTTDQGVDPQTGQPIRKWIDTMANDGAVVRRWVNRVGIEKVEEFLDLCLSLENLIDPHKPYLPAQPSRARVVDELALDDRPGEETPRLRVDRGYMEGFINPESYLEAQRKKMEAERERARKFPERRDRDVLGFLVEHAPLERWERDVLEVVRREAYYFAPQWQTKIMNEGWACVAPDTLVFSDHGLVTMRDLHARASVRVSDGEALRVVYDRHVVPDHDTLTVRTRRGFVLTGSTNHRVMRSDGRWSRLDELQRGDVVRIAAGCGHWPAQEVPITWAPPERIGLDDVAREAGVSVWTVLRHRAGRQVRNAATITATLRAYDAPRNAAVSTSVRARAPLRIPPTLSTDLAAFYGYLVGDGHISRVKRTLGLTTADREQALAFARLAEGLFGASPHLRTDGGRIRVSISSQTLTDFLTDTGAGAPGLTHGPSARRKVVPEPVLRSPAPVVAAFLRAYFDCDGHACDKGVLLVTASEPLGRQVQLLLLNFGVLSRRRARRDGTFVVHVAGRSAARFAETVGFGLARKQRALERYVESRRWWKPEPWDDEVVALERGRGEVYDISVADTHRYAAGGFVNHNSYWHSRIMTEKACDASEIFDYADRTAGVLATAPGQFNPYKVGIELFRHIEDRWNKGQFGKDWEECDDLEARRTWDRRLGLGRKKIFEVRSLYTDVTFIDEFLTPDFVAEQKLYTFGFNARNDRWEIESRKFAEVKEKLLFRLTNGGNPFIAVEDANHGNRGELLLVHEHTGVDLRVDWAKEVLRALVRVWKRPVEIHTVLDGKKTLLRFDGTDHAQRVMK
jgi:stage V sporulation protein R